MFLKGPGQVSGWQAPAWESRARSTLWAMDLMFDVNATSSHALCDTNGPTIGLPLDDSFVIFVIYSVQFGGQFFKIGF